jgi:hypothetical protein
VLRCAAFFLLMLTSWTVRVVAMTSTTIAPSVAGVTGPSHGTATAPISLAGWLQRTTLSVPPPQPPPQPQPPQPPPSPQPNPPQSDPPDECGYPATATPMPDECVWACVLHHESTDHYDDDTGNGYTGGFQFDSTSWRQASAGAGYPGYAEAYEAPPAVQDAAAVYWQSVAGWGQWSTSAECGA